MSKVITFSRQYPSYHPRKGEPTYFVEKILNGFVALDAPIHEIDYEFNEEVFDKNETKYHTIRAGHRFKVGDWFSPRIWSGKPYNSKQIIIAPDIKVKKTWDIEMPSNGGIIEMDSGCFMRDQSVADNDGLSIDDFWAWFRLPFEGQIICWNENIEY